MSRKLHLIYIYMLMSFKFNYIPYIYMLMSFKFNYIPYEQKASFNIYILFYKYVKEHIKHKNSIYNVCSAQDTDLNLVIN